MRKPSTDDVEKVLVASDRAADEILQTEFFYRQLALHMARGATDEFRKSQPPEGEDAVAAVREFLHHEHATGRIAADEIQATGSGYRIHADVHACPYVGTCKGNLRALGEVPQCMRAITLIEAVGVKIPHRPPMAYDLAPGLVDGTSDACAVELRPAGIPMPVHETPTRRPA